MLVNGRMLMVNIELVHVGKKENQTCIMYFFKYDLEYFMIKS